VIYFQGTSSIRTIAAWHQIFEKIQINPQSKSAVFAVYSAARKSKAFLGAVSSVA
jgi:hypothetical protein